MQKTREIPPEQWGRYLQLVAERERDHPVRVEVVGEAVGAQPFDEHAPLIGLSLEQKGAGRGYIEVTLGGPDGTLGHSIEEPEHIWVEESATGEVEAIDIEDRDQVKTLLVFEHPAMLGA